MTLLGDGFGDAEGPASRAAAPAAIMDEPRARRARTIAAVFGAAAIVAVSATLLAGGGVTSDPARPAVGTAVRARADALLTSLSARPAASSSAPALPPSAAEGAPSGAPAVTAAPAPTAAPALGTSTPSGARPSAAPKPAATAPQGKKPKYTRFD